MSDSPITHVSDTAFWSATFRANESERPDALFRDPLAARLVDGAGRAIAAKMGNARTIAWTVAVRTRLIDDCVHAAIAEGVDTVLNLGAGLDTRPYRMELPPSVAWIEVDFAESVEFKEHLLQGESPRCRLRRVKLDLGDDSARKALFERIHAESSCVLVLTEGVVPYLAPEQVQSLARDLRSQAHFERWILEYFSPEWSRLSRFMKHGRQLRRKFRPENWHRFFEAQGWAVEELRYLFDEGHRLHRPAPIPWWVNAMVRALPSEKQRAVERMFGYALLVPARRADTDSMTPKTSMPSGFEKAR